MRVCAAYQTHGHLLTSVTHALSIGRSDKGLLRTHMHVQHIYGMHAHVWMLACSVQVMHDHSSVCEKPLLSIKQKFRGGTPNNLTCVEYVEYLPLHLGSVQLLGKC